MTDTTHAPPRRGQDEHTAARLRWLLDLVTGNAPPPEADHFVEAFRDRHPEGIDALIAGWRAKGPFTVESSTSLAHTGWATLRDVEGTRFDLTLTVDTTGHVRRADLAAWTPTPVADSFEDVDQALVRAGVESTALVARRAPGGTWTSLYERDPDTAMPSGSVYKAYVLLALARAVERGEVRWDDEVELRPELRSLPTGEMQDLPNGARRSVRETARAMFARSDNTASDLIMDRIGRRAVEEAVVAGGHHHPDDMVPFPTSREVFDIGWGPGGLLDRWKHGAPAEREKLLSGLGGPLRTRIADMTSTAHPAGLDWFMSARDTGRVLDALHHEATRDTTGTLREIVTAYTGIPLHPGTWPVAIFKAGSMPGVVAFCWLLRHRAGTEYVVVLQQRAEHVDTLGDGLPLRRLGGTIIHSLLR